MSKTVVLIAGGTGLVGKELKELLLTKNYEVRILSRKPSQASKGLFNWDLKKNYIDKAAIQDVSVVINLTGAAVAGPKWTENRKKVIVESRVQSAICLFENFKNSDLKHYISASGINAYEFSDGEQLADETSPYGNHFLAQVVEKWEKAADQFSAICPVLKLRIGLVFSSSESALQAMAKPIKFFAGAQLGSGKQNVPWIDLEDLCAVFLHGIEKELSGAYNTINDNVSSELLHKGIASQLKRPLWPFKVPGAIINVLLGEQSTLVLDGLKASNRKLTESGFVFKHDLKSSLQKNLS